jgi:hypothetical protein
VKIKRALSYKIKGVQFLPLKKKNRVSAKMRKKKKKKVDAMDRKRLERRKNGEKIRV